MEKEQSGVRMSMRVDKTIRKDFTTGKEGASIGLTERATYSPSRKELLNTRKMVGEGALDTNNQRIDVIASGLKKTGPKD